MEKFTIPKGLKLPCCLRFITAKLFAGLACEVHRHCTRFFFACVQVIPGSIDLRHPSLGVLDWLYSLIRIHRVIAMAPLNWELRPSRKKVCLKCVVYIYVGKSYGIFLVIVIVVVVINPLSAE